MDDSITEFIKQKYNLLIGERTAEEIKISIGTAFIKDEPKSYEVEAVTWLQEFQKHWCLGRGSAESLSDVCGQIVKTIRNALESTPPELALTLLIGELYLPVVDHYYPAWMICCVRKWDFLFFTPKIH
ncbi:MAG: hypothetical protein Ct9H300mP28_30190 [Pseudomonadota bacterium]|nr:MAG: hypothetical protein Ct9H300mP28_30190 [Pseudomonadota bacterium]